MAVPNPLCRSTPPKSSARCVPLEQATQLPGAAFTDPAVLEWEHANFFRRGWICAGHVEQVSERGQYLQSIPVERACSSSATTTASRARS